MNCPPSAVAIQHTLLLAIALLAQGTMSHMAPEILMKGHLSKASDVYAVRACGCTQCVCNAERAWLEAPSHPSQYSVIYPPHICLTQFGILLWELYTGGHPFRSVPKALLGHQITKLHKRPEFGPGTPSGFAALAARCWDPKGVRRCAIGQMTRTGCLRQSCVPMGAASS